YETTTHFNGQSTVTIDGNRAAGESYTIAHHVFTEDGNRKIMIASLRYLDSFTKVDTISVSSLTTPSCLSQSSTPAGVSTWTRTWLLSPATLEIAAASMSWMNAA